jgi:hypothetical protein
MAQPPPNETVRALIPTSYVTTWMAGTSPAMTQIIMRPYLNFYEYESGPDDWRGSLIEAYERQTNKTSFAMLRLR